MQRQDLGNTQRGPTPDRGRSSGASGRAHSPLVAATAVLHNRGRTFSAPGNGHIAARDRARRPPKTHEFQRKNVAAEGLGLARSRCWGAGVLMKRNRSSLNGRPLRTTARWLAGAVLLLLPRHRGGYGNP